MLALRWNLVSIFVIRANQVIYNFTLMNNTWQKILQSFLVISVLHKNRFVFNCFLQIIATRSCEAVHGGAFFILHSSRLEHDWGNGSLLSCQVFEDQLWFLYFLYFVIWLLVVTTQYIKNTSTLLLGAEYKSPGELAKDFIFERNECIRMVSFKLKMTSLFVLHLF